MDSIKTILELSDINTQRVKWMEELAELTQAVARENIDNIVEEIADVEICIAQMIEHYKLDRMDIEAVRRSKVTRTIKRLKMFVELPKLKPCSCCGAGGNVIDIPGSCDYMHAVECRCCGNMTKMFDSKVKAIEAWNNRE